MSIEDGKPQDEQLNLKEEVQPKQRSTQQSLPLLVMLLFALICAGMGAAGAHFVFSKQIASLSPEAPIAIVEFLSTVHHLEENPDLIPEGQTPYSYARELVKATSEALSKTGYIVIKSESVWSAPSFYRAAIIYPEVKK